MTPLRIFPGASMSVNLSIKNVPDELAEKLRQRAEANHRSMQGELMAVLETSLVARHAEQGRRMYIVGPGEPIQDFPPLSLRDIWADARRQGGGTSDSVRIVRDMREERDEHLMRLVEADSAAARARALLGLPPQSPDPLAPGNKRRGGRTAATQPQTRAKKRK